MKKTVTFFLLCILFSKAQSQLYPQPFIDVQHYKFEVDVNDSNNILQGKTTIDVKFTGILKSFQLNLVNQNDTGIGMKILSITESGVSLKHNHANNKITIYNNATALAGETKTIVVTYQGIPADGLIISKNMYEHRTFFSDNWPDRIKNWLPTNDHPADKASIEFLVTAPDNYEVVSNGLLQSEKRIDNNRKLTHWKEDQLLPTKVFALGIADFEIEKSGTVSDSIPVYSWVFPENKKEGFYEYGLAPEILNFFIKSIGAYPYKKLANIQSKTIFGGMENAGAIFYNETTAASGNRQYESLLAHEIAHQWFGDMATEKSFDHLWLSEGFATYMTHLYMENKYGIDTLKKGLSADRNEIINFAQQYNAPVVDTTQTDYMNLLNANSYQKGSWVLHMLRRKVGDTTFWKIIQTYYKKYAGSNANTDDFRKVAEEISKLDLKQFFKQWLYTSGVPQLKITQSYNAASKKLKVTITQMQKTLFTFPLELLIKYAHMQLPYTANISKHITTLQIPVAKNPFEGIGIDKDVNLLFERVEAFENKQ